MSARDPFDATLYLPWKALEGRVKWLHIQGRRIAAPLKGYSRRVAVCGDDLIGGATGHLGHMVELPGKAAGAGGG